MKTAGLKLAFCFAAAFFASSRPQSSFAAGSAPTNVPPVVFASKTLDKVYFGLAYRPSSPNEVEIKVKNAITNYQGAFNSSLYFCVSCGIRAEMELTDSTGKQVSRTKAAKIAEQPLSGVTLSLRNRKNYQGIWMEDNLVFPIQRFDVSRYFELPHAGTYMFTLRLHLFQKVDWNHLKPITAPPITIELDMKKPER